MNQGTLIAVMTAAGTICSILFLYIGYQRGLKKDAYKDGNADGELKSDIQYIKRKTEDVYLEQRNTTRCIAEHGERITRVEESAKAAHKRLDRVEGGENYAKQI